MKILVTGGHGLVGKGLNKALIDEGYRVELLDRSRPIEPAVVSGFDAVVHLAGESIADGRWNAAKKQRIRDSRVLLTQTLAAALSKSERPPKVFVSASAIGYYGNRGDEVLNEKSASGTDFLSGVCREWEEASKSLESRGVRVVHLRFGVILTPKGGALAKMLLPFKLGLGGIIGDGKQYMSWVAYDDVLRVIKHALSTENLKGAVNVVAPTPATNHEYTRALGSVLSRPTIFPMPAFAARIAFGEMADALLLSSARVLPVRLTESGYRFKLPELEGALRSLLAR